LSTILNLLGLSDIRSEVVIPSQLFTEIDISHALLVVFGILGVYIAAIRALTRHLHDLLDVLVLGRVSDNLGFVGKIEGTTLQLDHSLNFLEGLFKQGEAFVLLQGDSLTAVVRRCDQFEL
jgi:hypothetical protein